MLRIYLFRKQVCIQLPTSAVNVALPTFAAVRRAAAPCCCGACRAAIDRYLLPTGPTAANPPYAAAAVKLNRETDEQTDIGTDTVPLHRPCFIYYASSANNSPCDASLSKLT